MPAQARRLEGWGEVSDPAGDCQFQLDAGKLTIAIPGKPHDLSAELNLVNAPRVLQEITGDFAARVKVTGIVRPGSTGSVFGRYPFQGTGLLLWQDAKNYVRLERAAILRDGSLLPYALLELREGGQLVQSLSRQLADQPTFLQIERRGSNIHGYASQDEVHWVSVGRLDAQLPQRIEIGVAAVNTSTQPFVAELGQLRLTNNLEELRISAGLPNWLLEAIVGAIVGGGFVLVLALVQRQRVCPDCGKALPRFRRPKNMRQRFWGGWTCPSCGCEVDRKGRKLAQ